jgi:hypothetical protein
MLVLRENEICPYYNKCPYNNSNECNGARINRPHIFTCEYVVDGKILENKPSRLPHDLTGKMKIIME